MGDRFRTCRGEPWGRVLQQALAGSACLRKWMRDNTQLLKEDRASQVGLLMLGGELRYLKYYQASTFLRLAQYHYGWGRPVRAFDRAAELRKAGVVVPQALSCLSVPGGAMLLTEGIQDSRDLHGLVREGDISDLNDSALLSVAVALAGMHCAGYAHGDCKWSNLLWTGQKSYLVDLDSVSRCGTTSSRQARDIARFTLNAEELALAQDRYDRFLAAYVEVSQWTGEGLVTAVSPLLEKLRRRHQSRYGARGHLLL